MDIQQVMGDPSTVTPYIWEIGAVASIFASLTITNWVKKFYKNPHFLKGCALAQTFAYVSFALYMRYRVPEVMFFAAMASILQWKIIQIVFHRANDSVVCEILRGDLYVPKDAGIMTKTFAVMTGGGVDDNEKTS